MGKYKHSDAVDYAIVEFQKNGYKVKRCNKKTKDFDFIAKTTTGREIKIVVRTITVVGGYSFIEKRRFNVYDGKLYMAVAYITSSSNKQLYLFPAALWIENKLPFRGKDYNEPGQVSEPEWGITFSQKTIDSISSYILNSCFSNETGT